jgi:hypothetical protein
MLERLFYCFDCTIEYQQPASVRDVWENKSTDAKGNKLKMYTLYINPAREIVFLDRDGTRMIYLKTGKIELPVFPETLYPLKK